MRVYKYLSAEFALRDLMERRIKVSEFGDMNDPFELMAVKLSHRKAENILRHHFRSNIGMLCFTKSWNNPLLWSHYGDKHKGICLGFDVSPKIEMHKTSYKTRQLQRHINIFIDAIRQQQYEAPAAKKVIEAILLTKFKAWEYEDEVRSFVRLTEQDGQHYYFKFNDDLALRQVICGPRCPTSTRSKIQIALTAYPKNIPIIKTHLNFASFKVVKQNY